MTINQNDASASQPPTLPNPARIVPNEAVGPLGPLECFYADKKANAGRLLTTLLSRGNRSFEIADRERTLARIDETDPFRIRTLTLAQRSLGFKSAVFASLVMGWVEPIITTDLSKSGAWKLDPTEPAQEVFSRVCRILGPMLFDKKTEKRAANLIILAMLWLSHTRQLDATVAASSLYRASRKGDAREPSSHQLNRAAMLLLARPPIKMAALRTVLDFAQLWVIRANTAQAEAHRRAVEAEGAFREARTLRDQLQSLQHENSSLEKRCSDLSIEVADLNERLRGEEITSTHALTEIRTRQSAFLTSLLDRYFGTALEAARMEPPRIAVIRERIEIAQESVQKEIEWLRSSD
jgi:hypothetical protein